MGARTAPGRDRRRTGRRPVKERDRPEGRRARARASQPAHRRRPIRVYQTTGTYVDRPPPFSPGLHLFGLPVLTCIVPAHDVTVRGGRLTCAPQRKWIGRRPSSIEPFTCRVYSAASKLHLFYGNPETAEHGFVSKAYGLVWFSSRYFFTRESCMHGVLNEVYL